MNKEVYLMAKKPRYTKSRKGAGNPSPSPDVIKKAHDANRKGKRGRTAKSVTIDNDLLEAITAECGNKTLADWDSFSDVVNYGLALVADEIQAARDMEAADANRQVESL